MLKAVKEAHKSEREVPMQSVSLDIWDKKYRLKTKQGEPSDQTMDDTYKRVARALADVEETEEKRTLWYDKFLWALRRGAIPAGRITSNAGALEHKPATSTINCTVSGIVEDSMNGILEKVHEAGLTLKAGCGIGYEFSTLRPKGAFVAGAGAYTSGPLSFMDIYDKMCFTVSSAGGRRGAQMATFDISHPDVTDFIKAKREAGRLRQFNLSCLITKEFMEAVKADAEWKLAFPVTEKEATVDGLELDDDSPGGMARMAGEEQIPDQSRWRGCRQSRLPRVQNHQGTPFVGCHHVLHLRFRRAGLHPDRPRQRDEQQLVLRKHPRHQPLRRAAAAALWRLPAGLGQPDQVRAQAIHRPGPFRLG